MLGSTTRSAFGYDAHGPEAGGVSFASVSEGNREAAIRQKQLGTGTVGKFLFGDGADDTSRAPPAAPRAYAYDPPFRVEEEHELGTQSQADFAYGDGERTRNDANFGEVARANAAACTAQKELARGTVGDFLFKQGAPVPIVSTRQAQDAATAEAAAAEQAEWAEYAASAPRALRRRGSKEFFENFL